MSTFSPVVTASLQAALLSATSNLLAQALTSYRDSKPLVLELEPVAQFAIFALLNTPPNFFWQQLLESSFPSQVPSSSAQHMTKQGTPVDAARKNEEDSGARQHAKTTPVPMQLSWTNTLIKFGLDQTLGAFVNTIVFIAGMSALRGNASQSDIYALVQRDTWPLMMAGLKVWPLVSLLSFTVIPPTQRIVFGSLVGVAWGVFLSIFASQ